MDIVDLPTPSLLVERGAFDQDREVLGLPERPGRLVTSRPGRHLDAERARRALADPAHAAYVDDVRVRCTAVGRRRADDVTAALGAGPAQPRLCAGHAPTSTGGAG